MIDYVLPTRVVIVLDDEGNGPTYPLNEQLVRDSFLVVNSYFAPGGIEFLLCEVDTIHNSELALNGIGTYSINYDPEFYNIYLVGSLGGPSGVAGRGGNVAASLSWNWINTRVLAHELAHNLDLEHTFGSWSPNNQLGFSDSLYSFSAVRLNNNYTIDDNNDGVPDCMQTADRICDTDMEYKLMPSPGIVDSNCYDIDLWEDVFDLNGDTIHFRRNNIMSYNNDWFAFQFDSSTNDVKIILCPNFFTEGQFDRMRYHIEVRRPNFACSDCTGGNNIATKIVSNNGPSGEGSLYYALACASRSTEHVTILFDNALTDSIFPLPYWDNILTLSNISIIGGNNHWENATIDYNQNHGVAIKDNIVLENLRFINSERSGLTGSNVTSCYFKNVSLTNNPFDAISIDIGSNITYEGGTISETGSTGLFFRNVDGLTIKGLTVQNKASNQGTGTGISIIQCNNVIVGGDDVSSENSITGYQDAIKFTSSTNYILKRNSSYCNINWVSGGSGQKPVINPIQNAGPVTGTCAAGSEIYLYRTEGNCTSCEGYEYLGKMTASGTSWSINPNPPLNDGDKVTAIANLNNKVTQGANCVVASVPVGSKAPVSAPFEIYPNPTKGLITFRGFDAVQMDAYVVYDMLGRKIEQVYLTSSSVQEIDISALLPGSYTIKFYTSKGAFSKMVHKI